MNVLDALHRTIHNPKHGGAVALATRMGMTYAVLNSKANPNVDTHHWRLDEALTAMTLLDDYSAMEAMAHQCGGVFVRLPDIDLEEVECLIALVMSATSEHGKFCEKLHDSMEDGEIDRKERQDMIAQLAKTATSLQAIAETLKKGEKQ